MSNPKNNVHKSILLMTATSNEFMKVYSSDVPLIARYLALTMI